MRNIYANLSFCIKYMQERIGCMPIGEMKRPGIVVGMAAEARIARRFGFPVATLSGAEALLADGADGLISFGIAGGLAPGLNPGTLVVATEVVAEDGRRYPALDVTASMTGSGPRADCRGQGDRGAGRGQAGALPSDRRGCGGPGKRRGGAALCRSWRAPGRHPRDRRPGGARSSASGAGRAEAGWPRRSSGGFAKRARVARSNPGAADGCAGYPTRAGDA